LARRIALGPASVDRRKPKPALASANEMLTSGQEGDGATMPDLRWARDQAERYDQAARHMREAATREGNPLIAERYNEIAERYETMVEQMQVLGETRADERWRDRS